MASFTDFNIESWTAGSGTEACGLCWTCGILIPQLIGGSKEVGCNVG